MTAAAQRPDHLCGARNRDVALHAVATEQNSDLQAGSPKSKRRAL
jgi:hypothetical protein